MSSHYATLGLDQPDILAATKAVAFAEDANWDAREDYVAGRISYSEYIEVGQACAYVRGIAAAGTPAQESP